jgi:hypothetical protein
VKRLPPIAAHPEPRLIVLPLKQRLEYTRKANPIVIEPKALAAPASNRPVFVPKAAVRESQPAKAAGGGGSSLEAVMAGDCSAELRSLRLSRRREHSYSGKLTLVAYQ